MAHTPEELTRRIEALRASEESSFEKRGPSGSAMAMRVAIELIAAVVAGGVVGYWLDGWLGTTPLLLIICMMFGTVAGLVTIKRVNDAFAKELERAEQDENQSE